MKTTIKITALAVITVLVALSCAPELTTPTPPDWDARDEAKKAEYTNVTRGTEIIFDSNLSFSSTATLADLNREIGIVFPDDADVLKVSNDKITDELKKFLTFHKYSNPGGSGYVPSTIVEADEPYAFERRGDVTYTKWEYVQHGYINGIWYIPTETWSDYSLREFFSDWDDVLSTYPSADPTYSGDNWVDTGSGYEFVPYTEPGIVVRLTKVPDQLYIVAKVKASAYKRGGQVVDVNGDYVGGDVYDDEYTPLYIGGGTSNEGGTNFYDPYVTVSVNLNIGSFDNLNSIFTDSSTNPYYPQLATVYSVGTAAQDINILNAIASKIEIQKYTNKTWTKVGGASVYNAASPPSLTGTNAKPSSDCIYAAFSPEDLGIYRVKAEIEPISKTTDNIGKGPAVIIVGNGKTKTNYSSTKVFYKNTRKVVGTSPLSSVIVTYDANKKNVVIKAYLSSTGMTFDSPAYPASASTDEFKLVYSKSGSNISVAANDLVEVKITGAVISKDATYDANPAGNNLLTITLDKDFQYEGNRTVKALINVNGLKYGNELYTFGGLNGNSFYNGTYLWDVYDLNNLKL